MANSRSNPAFRSRVFTRAEVGADARPMTLLGTIGKTAVLMLVTIVATLYTWHQVATAALQVDSLLMMGVFGGFVVGLATIFVPAWAPVTAPLYAVLEGVALGAISATLNLIPKYKGIPMEAVALTFVVASVMLTLYALGVIRATDRLRAIVVNATLAVCLYYLLDLLLMTFGHTRMPLMVGGGWMGIGLSVLICGIAAFNLILDFGEIEALIERGAPKAAEWYGGFSILVTLIWLYLEILRLLTRLRK